MTKIQHKHWDNKDTCLKLDCNMKNKPEVLKLLDSIITKDSDVLEVGCGPGHYLKYYENKVNSITGLDYSTHMLAITKGICEKANLLEGSCWELPFNDNSFDVVFQVDVCLHVGGSWDSIKEMIRVASKYVVFTGPSFDDFDTAMDKIIPSKSHGMRWAVSKPLLIKELRNLKYYFLKRNRDRNIKHSILMVEV